MDLSNLEVNDILKMEFSSTVTHNFVQILEEFGEFLRDTATVTIVNGMSVLFISVYSACSNGQGHVVHEPHVSSLACALHNLNCY